MKFKFFSFLTAIMIIAPTFFSNYNSVFAQKKAAEIEKLMQVYHDYGQFNGTVLVAEKGKVIFKKGYGYANMEWDIQNKPNTKFRLASITKQFTSMVIMQYVEAGKVELEGKIIDYLPDYRKDIGKQVTIHHLLTHTSGIPSYTGLPQFSQEISRDPYSVDEFVEKYCSGDLEFEPGSKFAYNNSGYFLLGAIIEKVSGKSYEQALKEGIFDPLNMKNTGYDHHGSIIKNRASGYRRTGAEYKNAPYLDMSLPYAAGSLYSTVEDLYIWDQALYTEKLLSQKYKDIMFTPFLSSYAYGWGVRETPVSDTKRVKRISHNGGINGFSTIIDRLVDDKHLIVILNNMEGSNINGMSQGIFNILYGKPYDMPKKSLVEALYKKIEQKDVAAAIEYYHLLKEKHKDDYYFGEGELNMLGYRLLNENKFDEAIKVFKFNIELHPKSFNPYDSLGEAYMKKGEKDLAIKNFAKSLELNPKNINAIEMLKKIIE